MSKLFKTIVLSVIISFSSKVLAQNNTYYFEVEKSGKGKKTIIFIPGFASSGKVWKETIIDFEKKFTCYTLTMSGFAGVKAKENSSLNAWVASIADYVKDKKIDKPIIVGHSMGGVMALAIAADYPELIDRIVIVDGLPCLAALSNPSFKSEEKPDCKAMIDQFNSFTEQQFYEMQKMTVNQLVVNESKKELILDWSMKSDKKIFGEMYCDFFNVDMREKIKSINCPTLVLLQSMFKNIEPTIIDQFKNLKSAKILYSNNGLHFIMYDDKEWFINQLKSFLND